MTPPRREEGISEAVGFILLLALIIMTFSIYLLYLMPAMGRENEIAQMSEVKERFIEYKLNIDTLWTSRQCQSDFGPALSLGSGATTGILSYFPFFSPAKAGAILALNQRAENITITSDSYFLVSSGGLTQSGPVSFTPVDVPANTTLEHFFINISASNLLTQRGVLIQGSDWQAWVNLTPNYFGYTQVNLTNDTAGKITGFTNWTQYQWNSTDITVNTYADGRSIATDLPVYRIISASTVYPVDLMSPVYGISTQFQAPQEISISLSDNTGQLTATYLLSYGYLPSVSTSTQPLGAIEYRSNNLYYTPQTYYYQLGGVFLEQSDGSSSEIPPAISISMLGGSPVVNVGEILILGGVASTQVSGSGPISISSAVTDLSSAPLPAGNNTRWVNLSIQAASTNASEMWNRTFQDLANRGGLPVNSYTTGRSGNVAFLNITGSPQTYDVRLSLTQVNVSADYVEEYSAGGISRSWRNVPGFELPAAITTSPSGLNVTTTALGSSTGSSTYGDLVTFTATVTPFGGPGTPTGTVTFSNGSIPMGTVPLSSGSASLSTSTMPVGTHSITATYNGDSYYQTSTSNAVSLTVNSGTPVAGTYWLNSTAVSGGYRMITTKPLGSPASGASTTKFFSDAFSGGEVLNAGTTNVNLWMECPAGSAFNITWDYGSGSTWTTLGRYKGAFASATPWLFTIPFGTDGHTFAAGEQLRLNLTYNFGSLPNSVYWDGLYNDSRVETPSSPCTPAFVQVAATFTATGTNPLTLNLPGPSTTGDLIVVSTDWGDQALDVTSITDSKGNPYSVALGPTNTGAAGRGVTYYASNTIGGVNTITVTLNGVPPASPAFEIYAAEYSCVASSSPIDRTSVQTGTGQIINSGWNTTTQASELIYGYGWSYGTSTVDPLNYTARSTFRGNFIADRTVSSTGSYSVNGSISTSVAWLCHMITFKGR